MVDNFPAYMAPILVLEGGYSNNPADRGGETCFGITAAIAARCGYVGAMRDMTQVIALAIYRSEFWVGPGFDRIDALLPLLAEYLLECGINLGPEVPSAFLQRALNVLNNQGALYAGVTVDGHCGPLTRAALAAYLAARAADAGIAVLMGTMRALAVVNYIEIAEANPTQEAFEYGWLRNRALGIQ